MRYRDDSSGQVDTLHLHGITYLQGGGCIGSELVNLLKLCYEPKRSNRCLRRAHNWLWAQEGFSEEVTFKPRTEGGIEGSQRQPPGGSYTRQRPWAAKKEHRWAAKSRVCDDT